MDSHSDVSRAQATANGSAVQVPPFPKWAWVCSLLALTAYVGWLGILGWIAYKVSGSE